MPAAEKSSAPSGLARELLQLPISIALKSFRLISCAVGIGGIILSYALGIFRLVSSLGLNGHLRAEEREVLDFVSAFQREYGSKRPKFTATDFVDAIWKSRNAYKLLFVYLHSPDHPDTPGFCRRTLCSENFSAFVNENFVAWGESIRTNEGFKAGIRLKATRFPFCAVVVAGPDNTMAVLQRVEGAKSPEEMLMLLQEELEGNACALIAARRKVVERFSLGKQDATLGAIYNANQQRREEKEIVEEAATETKRKSEEEEGTEERRAHEATEEQDILEGKATEAERNDKEDGETLESTVHSFVEKQECLENETAEAERKLEGREEAQDGEKSNTSEEAALARMWQEGALLLGAEPEKGPDITQVLIRFPMGERKERRFYSTANIQSLYDYVESLDILQVGNYRLVSTFPRVVYGSEKVSLSLKEAGLHPQASLFVELNSVKFYAA
ncbi:hypothetical protein JCGZ_27121 [Jatropha curcas]|uniref:UBX domain-containing protein n=1 Tax=Jatropha curcas TaxID=180498 RepID=A0A067JIY7_JATCU|nr:plant UBX domain-containing protein 10 isoform X2 [Jatropha curcas]KDP23832.1 hypothetical protein JCGZ_27121 [Jatropha curcas]